MFSISLVRKIGFGDGRQVFLGISSVVERKKNKNGDINNHKEIISEPGKQCTNTTFRINRELFAIRRKQITSNNK